MWVASATGLVTLLAALGSPPPPALKLAQRMHRACVLMGAAALACESRRSAKAKRRAGRDEVRRDVSLVPRVHSSC
eukprot:2447274-Pleurochrysis_carterae.AAC.6